MNVNTPAAPEDLAILIHADGSPRRARRRWIIIASVVVAAIVVLIAVISRGAKTPGPQYITAPVERGDLHLTVIADAGFDRLQRRFLIFIQ